MDSFWGHMGNTRYRHRKGADTIFSGIPADTIRQCSRTAPGPARETFDPPSAALRLSFDCSSTRSRTIAEQQSKNSRRCPEAVPKLSRTALEQISKKCRRNLEHQSKNSRRTITPTKNCLYP